MTVFNNAADVRIGANPVINIRMGSSLRWERFPTISGGTLTSDATYYYRTFTNVGSDSLTITRVGPSVSLAIDYLIVAGGGAGSRITSPTGRLIYGGGGGAGGVLTGNTTLGVGQYSITVGAGANAGEANGGSSSISGVGTSFGGGSAAWTNDVSGLIGRSGGSGGGGTGEYYANIGGAGGAGISGQGNSGGAALRNRGGGGGGKNSAGQSANDGGNGGDGGTYLGLTVGGGGCGGGGSEVGGVGGGGSNSAGVANTGGGGAGIGYWSGPGSGWSGGSGVVRVRYLRSAVGG